MDCFICNTRSAVESCSKCQALLCEECARVCSKCGHKVCPEHSYTTHKGKILCLPCQELRKARRSEHADVDDGVVDPRIAAAVAAQAGAEEEEPVEAEVLTASARKAIPPWKLSLVSSAVGAVLVLILLAIPSLRSFTLPWGALFPTPYLFLLIPAAAIFWSAIGFLNKNYIEDRNRCWFGLGIAAVTIVLIFIAVHTDPARVAARAAMESIQQRQQMSPAQLRDWRNQKLEKFRR